MTRFDRANLWLPIPVFLLAVAEMTGTVKIDGLQAAILISIGLTGSLHHIYSFTALLTVPDIRRLPAASTGLSPAMMAAAFVGLFLALTFLTGVIFRIIKLGGDLPISYFLFGQYFIDGSIAFFHTTRQTTALMRSDDFGHPAAQEPKVDRLHKIERFLAWAFVGLMTVSYVGIRSEYRAVHWGAVAVMSAISLWWVVQVARSPFRTVPMRLFSSRILLWPFYSASLVVLSALKAMHAFEYVQVFARIRGNLSPRVKFNFVVATVAGMALYFFVIAFNLRGVYFQLSGTDPSQFSWHAVTEIILPIYLSMAIMHVVIDSMIFRMRVPAVREVMTRFLFTKRRLGDT